MAKAPKGSKPSDDVAARATTPVPALLSNKRDDRAGPKLLKAEPRPLQPGREDQAGDVKVACDRRSRKTPLLYEVAAEILEQLLGRRGGDGWFRDWNCARATQVRASSGAMPFAEHHRT